MIELRSIKASQFGSNHTIQLESLYLRHGLDAAYKKAAPIFNETAISTIGLHQQKTSSATFCLRISQLLKVQRKRLDVLKYTENSQVFRPFGSRDHKNCLCLLGQEVSPYSNTHRHLRLLCIEARLIEALRCARPPGSQHQWIKTAGVGPVDLEKIQDQEVKMQLYQSFEVTCLYLGK